MENRYGVLYIDPPWHFRQYNGRGAAEKHYPTLTTPELCALDIPRLMLPDCAVFIWGVWPNLFEMQTIGAAWGLTYSTVAFVWAKTTRRVGEGWLFRRLDDPLNWSIGNGFATRSNTEFCLLFRQGKPKRKSRAVRQLIVAPRLKHSAKPRRVYSDIEALFDGPYLEIFSRKPREGWDAIGNDVDGADIRELLRRETTP